MLKPSTRSNQGVGATRPPSQFRDPRIGLGPCWYLCRDCKGSGGKTHTTPPELVKVDGERGKTTYVGKANAVDAEGKCTRCAGKGLVLEDHCGE